MDSVRPPRTFFLFPREIRDQIYKDLLGTTYIVYGQSFKKDHIARMFNAVPSPPSLAILQTSKAIKHEAEEVLYDYGIFAYFFNFVASTELDLVRTPDRKQRGRMRNVHFVFDMRSYNRDDEEDFDREVQDDLVAATVDRFTGTKELTRNTCQIKFWSCGNLDLDMVPSRFLNAIARMVSFKRLKFVVESEYLATADWIENLERDKAWTGTKDDEPIPCSFLNKHYGEVDYWFFLEDLWETLEIDLGPSVESDTPGAVNCANSKTLVFRPREFEVERVRAELHELGDELHKLRDELHMLESSL